MRLLAVTVENFGVFRDRQRFELAPHFGPDVHQNAIVFSGHNGSGKTSLFTAIQIALHGPLALGDRVSRDDYGEYVFHRLHRYFAAGETVVSAAGAVELELEYVQSGQLVPVTISRRWTRRSMRIEEQVGLSVNGVPVQTEPQTVLADLVPPSFLPVMFFDAEQLGTLSETREYEKLLQRNFGRLLGLDLAERLDADLGQFLAREDTRDRAAVLQSEVQHVSALLDELRAAMAGARERLAAVEDDLSRLSGTLVTEERLLAAEGGAFAERRAENMMKAERLRAEIATLEKRIAELAGELLPFVFTPALVRRLQQRLADEASSREQAITGEGLRKWTRRLLSDLNSDAFWAEIPAPAKTRAALRHELARYVRSTIPDEPPLAALHNVSDGERAQLQSWASEILDRLPSTIEQIGVTLDSLRNELRSTEGALASAPSDEVLQPYHTRIRNLQADIAVAERSRNSILAEIGALEFRVNEQQRFHDKLQKEVDALRSEDTRVELARRSRLATRAFHATMLRAGLGEFESVFADYFNLLCRKDEVLARVHVEPETFRMRFEAAAGHLLRLPNFSAGERQLVALAALWALRTVARRPLPLAVDTPLGRLDEVHRDRVLTDYLPIVADQVILFVTDAELAVAERSEFRNLIARVYRLRFDSAEQQTVVAHDERTPLADTLRRLDARASGRAVR